MQHPPPPTAPRYPFAYVNSGTEGYRGDVEAGSSQQQQQQQQQQQHSLRATALQAPPPLYAVAPLTSPSPASYAPMPYPPHQTVPHGLPPPPMAAASANGMRYLIPPQPAPLDQRAMSGARGKKEIKRRTKTGCLTCRKRRIKCDETQPACRNCAKSKRECLGYDPIFKQQAAPAAIQPAPAGSAPPTASRASTSPPPLPTSTQNFPQQQQQHHHHRHHQHQQHQHQQQTFAAPVVPYAPPAQYDGPSEYQHPLQVDPALGEGPQLPMARDTPHAGIQPQRTVRFSSIDQLFALDGVPPRFVSNTPPRPLLPAQQDEVRQFYHFHYAAGLDRLLETDWYTMHGLSHLEANAQLQDYVYQCVEQMRTAPGDPATSASIRSLEARLVWQLATMPLSSASSPQLATRIETLQALLTGQILPPHRVPTSPPPPPTESPNQEQRQQIELQYRQNVFWYHLAAFTAARDDLQDPSAPKQVNASLAEMRGILSNMENRDVLYSIAIARHIGGRLPDHHPGRQPVPPGPDPQDDINKLTVAMKFIEMEDQKGTTQVIQRVCSMALRGFALQKQ